MTDIINDLKKLESEHEKQLLEIRLKIRDIDSIPKAKALVGRYFRYAGGFGFLHAVKVQSYIYKRVIGIDVDRVITDSFQVDKSGHIEIVYGQSDYVDHFTNKFYTEITERQYFAAYKKMLKSVQEHGKR